MDLKEAYSQIEGVLRNRDFQDRLIDLLHKERHLVQARAQRMKQNGTLDHLTEFGFVDLDAKFIGRDRALLRHFEDYAIAELPQPAIISADDLQDVAFAQLPGMTDATTDLQMRRFVYHVLLRVSECQSGKTRIPLGNWAHTGFENTEDYEAGPLWENLDDGPIPLANGFVLDIEVDDADYLTGMVSAKGVIRGVCTAGAVERLARQIQPAVRSLVQSLKLATTQAELERSKEALFDVEIFEPPSAVPPAIGDLYEGLGPFGPVLDHALAFAFLDSPFARRVKNALEFTSLADDNANEAVALSLCVSALEALLCVKPKNRDRRKRGFKPGNSAQLQKRIPALLQAEQTLADSSASAIRALYDVRSRCLHGSDVPKQHEKMVAARQLVAAALRGVLEWATQDETKPEDTDDQKWTNELERETNDAAHLGAISGVSKDLTGHLRGFANVFREHAIGEAIDETDSE